MHPSYNYFIVIQKSYDFCNLNFFTKSLKNIKKTGFFSSLRPENPQAFHSRRVTYRFRFLSFADSFKFVCVFFNLFPRRRRASSGREIRPDQQLPK